MKDVLHYDTVTAARAVITQMADKAWEGHTNRNLTAAARRLQMNKWTAYLEVYDALGQAIDDECLNQRDNWTLAKG